VDFRNNPFKGLHFYAFEINILASRYCESMGVAPELCVDFRNNPFKGLHFYAFEINILASRYCESIGFGAPNGCSPRAFNGF
jgi:hypothetical protein